ncbi:MAG: sigma-70 family RNA polymerase sigma factor [candidate division Zixibacteria bacterium]|nr:sigma-70 family RNA polymerase sigma factor [candidate division Zixibacteria bacterium]
MTITAEELLGRIRKNDKQFLDELMLIIRRIAIKWSWTDQVGLDDVCQDCFIKVTENLRQGKYRQQASFKTYVYAIVRNTCIDNYKASRMADVVDVEKVTLVDQGSTGEEDLISKEERQTAARVLLALPRECRKLWQAIFFGKRTYREAAELLRLTEGTVKRKMWECRQAARKMVERFEK